MNSGFFTLKIKNYFPAQLATGNDFFHCNYLRFIFDPSGIKRNPTKAGIFPAGQGFSPHFK